MASAEYKVPLTSVGARMAYSKHVAGGANPYTNRIVDNMVSMEDGIRLIDERISDHPLAVEDDGGGIT